MKLIYKKLLLLTGGISRKKYFVTLLTFLVLFGQSCKKFVEVPPPVDQLTSSFVFTDDNTALQTITGIYSQMMEGQQQFSSGFTTFFAGMSADELYFYTPSFRDEFVNNQITIANHPNLETFFWNPCYRYIYAANKCIEGATNSGSLSLAVKNSIIGESKFIRAFCYFHLVNFFGGVPLVLSTSYQQSQSLPRATKADVYNQIIEDLTEAEALLPTNYQSSQRARPNSLAASALLARVYLYRKDWADAEQKASRVINAGLYTLDTDLNTVFEMNSPETIWQLCPVVPNYNTWEGFQIIPPSGSSPTYLLTRSLMNAFEINDQRKTFWTMQTVFNGDTVYYPYKYKVSTGTTITEYYVVLRLAEQLLIRAEARAQQNDIDGAKLDLNLIRNRSGLADIVAGDQQSILLAIEKERYTELFAEWGHRWFDLKRTNRADAILGALKPGTWQPADTLWPIPQGQMKLNPSLTQNPGY